MIAAGGSRTVAAEAAGISRDTLYGWLRRGTEDANATQTALDPDDYTIRELRALARTAQIPGYARLRKAGSVVGTAIGCGGGVTGPERVTCENLGVEACLLGGTFDDARHRASR